MMKILIPFLAFPLAGCGWVDVATAQAPSAATIKGTGASISQTRVARAAMVIEAHGAILVKIRRGPPKLVVEAQRQVLRQLRTEYRNSRLVVWVEGSTSSDQPVRVWYTGPNVTSVDASGATEIDAADLSGTRSVVRLTGASRLRATGEVGIIDVEVSGASEAHLRKLVAGTAQVRARGASKVWVRAVKGLNASASGASEIRYAMPLSGTIHQRTTGASSVAPG